MDKIWQFRDFIWLSVKREFKQKYQNSLLGALWSILNPLAMIVIYTVVFSSIMSAKFSGVNSQYAYGIYICSGILAWGLFAEIVTRGQNILLDNANLLKKVSFPIRVLPVILVISAQINFAIIFMLFTCFLLVTGTFPGNVIIATVPITIVLIIFATGLALTVSVLNVFFRDVGHLMALSMQFWFWLTPIVYPINILPELIQNAVLLLNPLTAIVQSYQSVLVYQQMPDWLSLSFPLTAGLLLCILGQYLTRLHASEIVDEL
jgi:lipopolysaccharide transport system permease protein